MDRVKVTILILLALGLVSTANAIENNPGYSPCGAIQRVAFSNLMGQMRQGWITQAQVDAEFARIVAECPTEAPTCDGEKMLVEMHQRWMAAVINDACKGRKSCINRYLSFAK